MKSENNFKITIIGAGKLGQAIAKGILFSGKLETKNITLTKRNLSELEYFAKLGFKISKDNATAIKDSEIILLCVGPNEVAKALEEIKKKINSQKQIIVSTATGVSIKKMKDIVGDKIEIIRAMPNTAIAICQSMTCLTAAKFESVGIKKTKNLFDKLGKTLLITEDLMAPATALCASGVAFFLRSIRAASQGGTEIGFHADEAIMLAAQTAKGAASLILESEKHPESEIDKVTTPKGITIAGLNEMEHQGFSSAMIKAIVTSASKIEKILEK